MSTSVQTDKPRKRVGIDVDFIFDIETESWDKFTVGGLLDVKEDIFFWYPASEEENYAKHLLGLDGTLWAHNGGRFDTLWLAEWIRRLGLKAEVFASSARITLLKCNNVQVRDSFALVPLALSDAAGIAGLSKLATGLPCICNRDCGGYCSIKRQGMAPDEFNRLVKYLEQDCRADAAVLQRLEEYARQKDLDLRGTIGASAWATARRRYNLPDAKWDSAHYALARKGYYGGRVQVFRPLVNFEAHSYDINSAYPDALARIELPVGKPTISDDPSEDFLNGWPGIYTATVFVPPHMHIPPLPWRSRTGRIHYPIMRFTGTWTELELKDAVNNHGVEILQFGPSIIWPRTEPVLKAFAKEGWALRAEAGKASSLGKWCKWFLNSLTGKLAQKPETETCFIDGDYENTCPANGLCHGALCGLSTIGCCPHRCMGTCTTARPIGKAGSGIWATRKYRIPTNGFVQWAAYLTSATRIKLGNQLRDDNAYGLTAVYTDTDNAVTTSPRTDGIGDEGTLGAWLFEGRRLGTYITDDGGYLEFIPAFEALGPKMYRMRTEFPDKKGNHVKVRAKGISEPDWNLLKAHLPVTMARGVQQFRTAARGDRLFEIKKLSRRLNYDGIHYGDRAIDRDYFDGEVTRPLPIPADER